MRKSLIVLLIALLAGLPIMGVWPGEVQAAGDEDGTPGNPYLIRSAADLYNVRNDLTASYRLERDIDLSVYPNWEPIGTSTGNKGFKGTFDGAGYSISGLTIDSGAGEIGLFGYVSEYATIIRNVRLVNVNVKSTNLSANAGGLVGLINHGTIENSSVSGTIEGIAFIAGGLVGQSATSSKLIMNSSSAKVNISGNASAGGLVGGLTSSASIEQSYATGDVFLSGSGAVGGLVGDVGGEILNSYATGSVASASYASAGGLIGMHQYGTITNSYAVGTVSSGSSLAGGLIGEHTFGVITLTNSYWNLDANPLLETIGGETGKDEAVSQNAMKQKATYAGWWDDPAIWGIQEDLSYPYLLAFTPELKVDPIPAALSVQPGFNEITISGTIRDGSIGEPIEVGYIIQNAVDATVTSVVYATYATGEEQAFHFTALLNETDYPDGTYTLKAVWEDTVGAYEQLEPFTFIVDTTPPEITLAGSDSVVLQLGDTFTDPGAAASDRGDDVTSHVTKSGIVDTSQTGTYTITYQVTDAVGNTATKSLTVKVYNSLSPRLFLNGLTTMEVEVGDTFTDPGATASDERDGDITDQIVVSGTVNTGLVGTYPIEYRVTNSLGYESSTNRIVEVVDRTPPVLTLRGANPMQLEVGSTFTDPGATAVDAGDGDLTSDITVSGAVYANRVGTYTLTYKVKDHAGNAAADAVRTVNVVDTSSPDDGGNTGGNLSGDPSTEEQPDEDNAESPASPASGCPFTDMEKHWAKSVVCEAAEQGIVAGVNAHTFMPNAAVTRTEFAAMLLRALRIEIDEDAGPVPFSDQAIIPKWADLEIRTAVAKGILSGYADGTLRPIRSVNRSEMAVMVSKAMKWEAGSEGNAYFSDDASIPAWAGGYVEAARARGILSGRDGNRFAPAEATTRAEAAVVLLRLRKVLN